MKMRDAIGTMAKGGPERTMADSAQGGTCCCAVPMPGVRMLTFPDGTRSGVFGLDEILAAVYEEGREVTADTADEIVERLAARNYIDPAVRQRYCDLLILEYGKYVEGRVGSDREGSVSSGPDRHGRKTGGLFFGFLKRLEGALRRRG